jgi:NAD(P)H-hydrate epimerase
VKTVTAAEMQALDRRAIGEYGIPGLLLMENAGRGIADLITGAFKPGTVVVFAGKGNNGGDGFVIARHLSNRGFRTAVILLADAEELKEDPGINFKILKAMKIPVEVPRPECLASDFLRGLEHADLVVDALFGIGLERQIEGTYREAVEAMNGCGKAVVAVDVPSGLHSDTGEVLGCAVKAAITGTLGLPKRGLFCGQGPEYSGRVFVVDIGIPSTLKHEAGI